MQTANESINPRRVRERLEALKSGVSGVAAAEAALMKSKAERMSALRREAMRHDEADQGKLDIRVHALNEEHRMRMELSEAAMEARSERVRSGYHAAKAGLAARIQAHKDRRIGKVQGGIMRQRHERQEELKDLTTRQAAFQKELGGDRMRRRKLRASVLSSFRPFRPLIDSWFLKKHGKWERVKIPERPNACRSGLVEQLNAAQVVAEEARALPLVRFFRFLPPSVLALVITGVHLWIGMRGGAGGVMAAFPSWVISQGVLFLVWGVALLTSLKVIRRGVATLGNARRLDVAAEKQYAARLRHLQKEILEEESKQGKDLSETFRESDDEWRALMAEGQKKLDAQFARLPEQLERVRARRLERLIEKYEADLSQARGQAEEKQRSFEASQARLKASIDGEVAAELDGLGEKWRDGVAPVFEDLRALEEQSVKDFPAWSSEVCASWEAPDVAPSAVRVGEVEVAAGALAGGMPGDARFALDGDGRLAVPFALGFPDEASLLIESDGSDDGAAARALHAVALRLIGSHPPGRVSFVLIDPVGLGKDFAGLMHLADYEETLITHRIWTQSTHIEERLAELNEHIEKVIQMYLRDEYATITEYNEQAGTIAEKYRFVVIAGFPSAFSDTAAKRLLSIASSGPRCGVQLLIQRDLRQVLDDRALEDELQRTCRRIAVREGGFYLADEPEGANELKFDPPPSHEDSIRLVHRIGKASVDSNRVKVPFSQVAPPDGGMWTSETAEQLLVPIGRTGAKKLQMLVIGKGTKQHMLVAGKTGSGKSTLFHVIITNLALWCSPKEVEFYLVDFKKGVEFKCYGSKRLPHARVVAIESDREFALSVLQRVDAELKRRGELFRQAGAQDLGGYKRGGGEEAVPRSLLLIDEFQEFFTEDDAVAQEASLLLDRIVRQGRAFGIHVILGSQTLGGAYTLARATLGQMVIRVALQCNETDAHLIMDDDNPAPRLLTRPGEGIYNDQAGAVAANSPFQIVWLPEEERDEVLDRIAERAEREDALPPAPIVFEGNAPADIRDNAELKTRLANPAAERPRMAHAWLGAPNSIKGPTEAVFQRQSGSHLLVVGQSAERSMSLLTVSLVSLAAQYPADQAEFVVLDPHFYESGSEHPLQRLSEILPHKISVGGPAEAQARLGELSEELVKRGPSSGRGEPEVFLLVHDLQRFKVLRPEDEFQFSLDDDDAAASPSQVFSDLLGEGGPCGMHVLATTDTWNNVSRWIPRKLMAEFEMRVLFQMSANDSANLIDSQAATVLGLHRALFYNEHLGTLETFRPYALPDPAWFGELADLYGKG